jgi:predicted ABC-type ATPase
MPLVIVVAGPNGAGKTTFAKRLLARLPGAAFVNADEIASELPPAASVGALNLAAGRALIERLDALMVARQDTIILETTLASRRYLAAIPRWRTAGYDVDLYYLRLPSAEVAVERVRRRVEAGGHGIPETDVRRRFMRSLDYLKEYTPLVSAWYLYDSLEGDFDLVLLGENNEPQTDGD